MSSIYHSLMAHFYIADHGKRAADSFDTFSQRQNINTPSGMQYVTAFRACQTLLSVKSLRREWVSLSTVHGEGKHHSKEFWPHASPVRSAKSCVMSAHKTTCSTTNYRTKDGNALLAAQCLKHLTDLRNVSSLCTRVHTHCHFLDWNMLQWLAIGPEPLLSEGSTRKHEFLSVRDWEHLCILKRLDVSNDWDLWDLSWTIISTSSIITTWIPPPRLLALYWVDSNSANFAPTMLHMLHASSCVAKLLYDEIIYVVYLRECSSVE